VVDPYDYECEGLSEVHNFNTNQYNDEQIALVTALKMLVVTIDVSISLKATKNGRLVDPNIATQTELALEIYLG
jgi:hypothetical protein